MARNTIETPPSFPDVLAPNIKFIKKGEYELDLPSSFSFGPPSGGQAATVQAGLEQKRAREMGVTKIVDAESGSYRAPAMITPLATSIEIKKLLPPRGTKWLFMRAQAKEVKDGRLSMEVMLFDEGMELVALS
ncbi:uncharacterized protein Bfra_006469ia [Botrytis fragariae]|uniref:Acyl-CoA thioesterase-like C-terminal domain-containing protein n=1 Tax=Botrytis fragariae TaxID=1964551 RepID=A0A8H6B4H2_9HELO|nr:uncharacterized protein Bfra_006469ia [Botrytis fragariae]KAF5879264.1 hypothetical protein Bfra_006469ia [Botrytis fragariae]